MFVLPRFALPEFALPGFALSCLVLPGLDLPGFVLHILPKFAFFLSCLDFLSLDLLALLNY